MSMKGFFLGVFLASGLAAPTLLAQHDVEHMAHMNVGQAASVRLDVQNDEAARVLTIRLGPLSLPAHAGMNVPQAPELMMAVPFDGWLTAYHPRLTDESGNTLSGRLLHHVAFYNIARSDFLCPQRAEHIFGAGGEMAGWPALPGLGYRVRRGDPIRISTMFHNDSDTSYPQVYLEVAAEYQPMAPGGPELKSVYPVWFDVKGCADSAYDLGPGRNLATGSIEVGYPGRLTGVGGHLHDYGQQLQLVNVTRQADVARLNAKLDPQGHILSIPIVRFTDRGGYPLDRGDVVKVTALYDNPTGQRLPGAAMGIVVGYFLPAEDGELAALRRKN